MTAKRITVEDARKHLDSDEGALLVCAYDDHEQFDKNHLEGALTMDDFRAREDDLPKEEEVIFYCD